VGEDVWPSPQVERRRLALGARGLGEKGGGELRVASPATTGIAGGAWCPFGPAGLPGDQRPDDERSLCFDTPPLAERLEILGAPAAILVFAADRPFAQVALRLCDVAPDGASSRVSYGLANLCHAPDHGGFAPLVPGARRELRVVLNDAAWSFAPGHRVRLAISTAYWPIAWPAPAPVTLTVFGGSSALELPVRQPRAGDEALRGFAPPEAAPRPEVVDLEPGGVRREVSRDPRTGEVVRRVCVDVDGAGRPTLSRVEPIDLEVGYGIVEELRIRDDDPLSARVSLRHESLARRGSWSARVETHTRVSADAGSLRVEAELRALEGETQVFARRWDERVPRAGF
jgi:hypothetical protein